MGYTWFGTSPPPFVKSASTKTWVLLFPLCTHIIHIQNAKSIEKSLKKREEERLVVLIGWNHFYQPHAAWSGDGLDCSCSCCCSLGTFSFFAIFIIFRASRISGNFRFSKFSEFFRISMLSDFSEFHEFSELSKFSEFTNFPDF